MISQELRQLKRQTKKINKMELVLKNLIYGEEYYSHIIVKMMDYDDALAKKIREHDDLISKMYRYIQLLHEEVKELKAKDQ